MSINLKNEYTFYEHQKRAFDEWKQNNRHGILTHVTGSGKTIVALYAIYEHFLYYGNVSLITVPTNELYNQWKNILDNFQGIKILKVGNGNSYWKRSYVLEKHSSENTKKPVIILTTMKTASKPDFRRKINDGNHIIYICDEVHYLGSTKNSSIMRLKFGAKLGMSATYERNMDYKGTKTMTMFFRGVLSERFDIKEAINKNVLSPYEYVPHILKLTKDENVFWNELSSKIAIALMKTHDDGIDYIPQFIQNMMFKRSRIVKKAQEKITLPKEILNNEYKEGQMWFIYCEDRNHLYNIKSDIENDGFKPLVFHSFMKPSEKKNVIQSFKKHGGILLSIRCLDEGIDIPEISHAIILSSSKNPLQFIQRRGRILRKCAGKEKAVIHDAIIMPNTISVEDCHLNGPDKLLRDELMRSIEFSKTALNSDAYKKLYSMAKKYNIIKS